MIDVSCAHEKLVDISKGEDDYQISDRLLTPN